MARDKDGLTGLFTDEFLKDELDAEISRARRFGRELGFLLLEPVLPSHLRTDMLYQTLKQLASICKQITRQIDIGIRWGQQLLYILPETSAQGVKAAFKKISTRFQEHSFKHDATGEIIPGKLRYSYIVFPGDIEEKKELLQFLRDNLKEE